MSLRPEEIERLLNEFKEEPIETIRQFLAQREQMDVEQKNGGPFVWAWQEDSSSLGAHPDHMKTMLGGTPFVLYSKEISSELETNYLWWKAGALLNYWTANVDVGSKHVKHNNGSFYTVDFTRMRQRNQKTGFEREVRRMPMSTCKEKQSDTLGRLLEQHQLAIGLFQQALRQVEERAITIKARAASAVKVADDLLVCAVSQIIEFEANRETEANETMASAIESLALKMIRKGKIGLALEIMKENELYLNQLGTCWAWKEDSMSFGAHPWNCYVSTQFELYSEEVSAELEVQYLAWKTGSGAACETVTIDVGSTLFKKQSGSFYTTDFARMRQRNQKTGFEREISS